MWISFIKNETFGVPMRVDGILKSLKDSTYTPVFPKRNYVFTEEVPTVIEEVPAPQPKIIPIQTPDNQEVAAGGISVVKTEPKIAASNDDLKLLKFDNK